MARCALCRVACGRCTECVSVASNNRASERHQVDKAYSGLASLCEGKAIRCGVASLSLASCRMFVYRRMLFHTHIKAVWSWLELCGVVSSICEVVIRCWRCFVSWFVAGLGLSVYELLLL